MTVPLVALPKAGPARSWKIPAGGPTVSSGRVSAAIRSLIATQKAVTQTNWLGAVARLVSEMRPDLAEQLVEHLGVQPSATSPLEKLSMGEIGVVYEALIALSDHRSRREKGQYFTPDDVARFMAAQAARFPQGDWLDPCCGVGNLSFHLAHSMVDPGRFVARHLTLIDMDAVALKTAAALLVANFATHEDTEALPALMARSQVRDFLSTAPLPPHSFTIVNPPYARTTRIARFKTAEAGELYAYFLERIATTSKGFIAITPASHLGGAKYASLRRLLSERSGGEVLVFDNVPDTCFRGYKYGSTNTSKTNFVRAAITVSAPSDQGWKVTPILRWAARSRARMWASARTLLVPLRLGPSGEWAKVMPKTESVWDALASSPMRLKDLVTRERTVYELHVASTPRYYISATKRDLDRGSKHVLYFKTRADMERAYVLLNSSLPYWWWRCLDGGITLPLRTLLSTPVPPTLKATRAVVKRLEDSEESGMVTKLNAGRQNENVRRPRELVEAIDASLLVNIKYDFGQVYASDMFATS
jgi:SAM-dependent methyltransferase